MTYKVFISHSTNDRGLVIALANLLTKFDIQVYVAEWYLQPGEPIDKKVFTNIDNSDCVVVLLTHNGVRSKYVHQEIGYAIKSKKTIIPLVEQGISQTDLGSLRNKEYIEYNSYQPENALIKTSNYVKSLKLDKEEKEKALLVTGGILAFLLLLSGAKK